MAYKFEPGRSVQDNVRHIAESQIGKAIAGIDDNDIGIGDTVHQIRKRCKKMRGLIRLVRPCFAGYAEENATFRDVAATLSKIRDAKAIMETHDALIGFYSDQLDTPAFPAIRNRFLEQSEETARAKGVEEKLVRFRRAMIHARARIGDWRIEGDGFAAVAGGLCKTYKRGRKALAVAEEGPTVERLHDWRKRVKYHWYQARLLSGIWPKIMKSHVDAAKHLADRLGDHHDIAVLHGAVTALSNGEPETIKAYTCLAEGRKALLEAQALNCGCKLFAEKPSALKRRWRIYWEAMRSDVETFNLSSAA